MPFIQLTQANLEYEYISGVEDSSYSAETCPTDIPQTQNPNLSPTWVLLHEGLGAVSTWKDFPLRLAKATRYPVLTYSRLGHGRSSPLPHGRNIRTPDFMHYEAWNVLPELLLRLNIKKPLLLGHSDGSSIALLYAARYTPPPSNTIASSIQPHHIPNDQAQHTLPIAWDIRMEATQASSPSQYQETTPPSPYALIVIAPHICVENLSIQGIKTAKDIYQKGMLRERLIKYHDDVDGMFWGWNDIWLSTAFRSWNIEDQVSHITCPMLAIQGAKDEYGTLYQIEEIQRRVPKTNLQILSDCGHIPHLEQTQKLLDTILDFCQALTGETPNKYPTDTASSPPEPL